MQKSIFIFSFAPANIIKEEDENPEQSSHTVKLKQHFNMKHFTYLLLIAIFLIGYKAKAQTSASMGLNGVVEEYVITEYDDEGYGDREIAIFNPKTKRLTSFKRFCVIPGGGFFSDWGGWVSFNVKGNRPMSLSKFVHVPSVGDCPNNLGGTITLTYKYKGNLVSSLVYKCTTKDWLNGMYNFAKRRKDPGSYVYETGTLLYKYTYTQYDYFGNWIERRCECFEGSQRLESTIERRSITYNSKWAKAYYVKTEAKELAKYESKSDLSGLKDYLKDKRLENETKSAGKALWNKLMLGKNIIENTDTIRAYYADTLTTIATRQSIKQAWSSMKFQQLKASNNHNGLYFLAMDSLCTTEIADSARAYWNEKEWALVSDKNTSYQDIAKVAAHPFAYPAQAQAGWRRVQQQYYDKVVLSHNDFRDVERDYKATLEGKRIFSDIDYAKQVTTRLDSLRNAEISAYLSKAQSATSNKAYKEAVEASQHVLSINPNHPEAIDLSAENGKHYLEQLKKQKKLTDEVIKEYIDQNPFGKYTLQMKDMRAVRLAKLAHSNKQIGEFDSIAKLPMSDEARKEVNSLSKRTDNRINRGNFLHFGAEASLGYGFGADMLDGGGGAYVRLGWTVSPINVTTGFTYTAHKNKTLATSRQNEEQGIINGAMDYSTMEIPLQLRWNFMRNTGIAFYLAAGAEYHLNKKGKMAYKDLESREKAYVKDDALLKKNNFVGYYSFGLELQHTYGMELYVKHDYTDRFDKDYVRQQYGSQSASNLLLFNNAEKSQLGKNWSIGVKIRIFY